VRKKIKVGLVGTSSWSEGMHIPCIKSHENAFLNAICGRSAEKAENVALRNKIPRFYTDYNEMIERGGIDAIIIASPDHMHFPIAKKAIKHGLHVLCEKPLTMTYSEAKELYQFAKTKGIVTMIYFVWRWTPHFAYIQKLIQDDFIGEPLYGSFSFLYGTGAKILKTPIPWRRDYNQSLGALGDLCSHMADLSRYYFGEIDRVSAELSVISQAMDEGGRSVPTANDSAIVNCKFKCGASGTISGGIVSGARPYIHIKLIGRKGILEADLNLAGQWKKEDHVIPTFRWMAVDKLDFTDLALPEEYGTLENNSLFMDPLTTGKTGSRLFVNGILNGTEVTPSFYDGMKTQAFLDASILSEKENRKVELKEIEGL
jgi:predicted dehydrogenase